MTREFIPLKGKQLLLVEKLEADIERLNDLLWQEAGNRVEIERLRELVASLQASSGYEASIAQLEIERLTRRANLAENECDAMNHAMAALGQQLAEAGRDNARLRAAVQQAAQSALDEFVEDLTSQQRVMAAKRVLSSRYDESGDEWFELIRKAIEAALAGKEPKP